MADKVFYINYNDEFFETYDLGEESFYKWQYMPGQGGSNGCKAGLPPGLSYKIKSLVDIGVVSFSGRPTEAGWFQAVFDTNKFTGAPSKKVFIQFFVESVNIKASPDLPQILTVGKNIVPITITASGGTEPYTYKEYIKTTYKDNNSGTKKHFIPSGLSFNPATRTLSGAPQNTGDFEFWLGASDAYGIGGHSYGNNGWKYFKVEIIPEALIKVIGGNPHKGFVGDTYTDTLSASGGTLPYTYVLGKSAKDLGVSVDSKTGKLTWTTPSLGRRTFWVGAHDAHGSGAHEGDGDSQKNGWLQYEVTVEPKTIHVGVSQTPPDWVMGDTYPNINIVTSGGSEPYRYEATGHVPPGLAVQGAVFSGTPKNEGFYKFSLVATDKDGNTGHIDCHVTIYPELSVWFEGNKHATVGVEYKGEVFSSGGYPPVRLEMDLPEGLRLEPYVDERDPHKDASRARVAGKPTKPVVGFLMKPDAIDSKNNRLSGWGNPEKLTVAPAEPVGAELAVNALRGHLIQVESSTQEILTITGQVSGPSLSEHNKPSKVILQIKQPGQSTFVDAKTLGTLDWATNWKPGGWEFTLSGRWSAQSDVPRFEMLAKLDSHKSKAALVRFPLSDFVKNLHFRNSAEDEVTEIAFRPGPQTLHLHMAFYNALDQLTAKLALPDGITGKALLPAVNTALPRSLQVRSDWDGHTQNVLFEISKGNPLRIASGTHQTVNLSIPVDVATAFRPGDAKCELSSSSESVENIPNDTQPERATLSLTASTS